MIGSWFVLSPCDFCSKSCAECAGGDWNCEHYAAHQAKMKAFAEADMDGDQYD